MPDRYDALVIGGGPGGAAAALLLARAGRAVAVLEKMAEGPLPKRVELGVDGQSNFTVTWRA